MIKIRLFCGILCLIMALGWVPVSATEPMPDASVISGCHTVDAMVPLIGSEKMLETSQAVILYERNSDTLVYTYEPDKQVDPSSMVKLMTALIAAEQADLNQMATVSHSALAEVGVGVASVKPRLKVGETLSVESLLYCMMAASDNDSAVILAETIAGSHQAFVDMMNARARELGCTNTYFANAHGLYDETAYSTARDICRILDAALENELFRTLFTARNYTVPATSETEPREVQTTNYMMSKDYTSKYFDARVTGGKTGTDKKDGRCLAVTAEDNGMELIAIVLGAQPVRNEENPVILDAHGNFEEMKVLLDYASENLTFRKVFYKGQTFSQYPVSGGANDVITTPVQEASAVLPLDFSQDQIRWALGQNSINLTAPVEAGQAISYVEAWYGNICIAQSMLVAMHDVDVYTPPAEPTGALRQQEEDNAGAVIGIILGVIVGLVVLVIGGMFLVAALRKAGRDARRRRRKNRRSRNG